MINDMKQVFILSTSPIKHDGLSKMIYEITLTSSHIFHYSLAAPEQVFNTQSNHLTSQFVLPKKKNLFSYLQGIKKIVQDNNYDIIYIHGNSALMFPEVCICKLFSKSMIVTHCHNSSTNHPFLHFLFKPVFNLLVDKKIGCSSIASKWAYLGKNIYTIPNGISLQQYKFNKEKRISLRKQYSISESQLVVGHIGRFTKQKNHLFLLNIMCHIVKQFPDSLLFLIGDGECKNDILSTIHRLQLDRNVIIINPIENVSDYYNLFDMMILPSLFEGLPLVALEAQANGLPILVSDHLTPETFITNYAIKQSLSNPPSTWASTLIQCYNSKERGTDLETEFVQKGQTKEIMLQKIIRVLDNEV